MDSQKNDHYFLELIKTDLKFVIDNTRGKSLSDITHNPLLIDSIMFRVIQISENCGRLSEDFKSSTSNVPWKAIKGMRNKIVHNYGETDLSIVYDTVIHGIPEMYEILNTI